MLDFFTKIYVMANGKDFVDRVDMILKQKNIKRMALATEIGQTVQAFTDWKRRDSIPSVNIVVQISQYLDVSLEWLITGKEPQNFECSELEKQFLNSFRLLDEHDKQNIKGFMQVMLNNPVSASSV